MADDLVKTFIPLMERKTLMTSPNYRLVSFNLCPFVQRSVITLNEKNAKYEIEYIDRANKPDWFLKISPLGLVPVLDIG